MSRSEVTNTWLLADFLNKFTVPELKTLAGLLETNLPNRKAEIAAIVAKEGFKSLKGPIARVTTPDVHIPFSPALEKPLYPNKEKIVAAVRRQLERD